MASDCVPLAQQIQHAQFQANSVVYLVPIMRASFAAVQKSPFKSDSTNSRSIQNPKLPLLAPKPPKNSVITNRTRQSTFYACGNQNSIKYLIIVKRLMVQNLLLFLEVLFNFFIVKQKLNFRRSSNVANFKFCIGFNFLVLFIQNFAKARKTC